MIDGNLVAVFLGQITSLDHALPPSAVAGIITQPYGSRRPK